MTYAMSCLRANPLTGEMIDGDVIFDASWIRYWKQEYAFLTGTTRPIGPGRPGTADAAGDGPRDQPDHGGQARLRARPPGAAAEPVPRPPTASPRHRPRPSPPRLERAADPAPPAAGVGPVHRLSVSASGCAPSWPWPRSPWPKGTRRGCGRQEDKDEDGDGKKKDQEKDEPKLPEEFLGQMIKEVVMHEVGHSLGLRHNFKASTMLDADQLNDTAITRVKGMIGQRDGLQPDQHRPQGPEAGRLHHHHDRPLRLLGDRVRLQADRRRRGRRAQEDRRPVARARPGLRDRRGHVPGQRPAGERLRPRVRHAPVRQGPDRAGLRPAEGPRRAGSSRTASRGRGSATRSRILLAQWGNGAYLAAEQIGGQSVSRDHKGDKGGQATRSSRSAAAKQREALAFLADNILSDKAFKFSPALLRRLASERWYHWGNERMFVFGGGVDYPINEEILGIQKIVLGQCLDAGVLKRLQNQELESRPRRRARCASPRSSGR